MFPASCFISGGVISEGKMALTLIRAFFYFQLCLMQRTQRKNNGGERAGKMSFLRVYVLSYLLLFVGFSVIFCSFNIF